MSSPRRAADRSATPLPPRVREYYRRKQRYETAPAVGAALAAVLMIGLLIYASFSWSLILPLAAIASGVIILRFVSARQRYRKWEASMQDWHDSK